jgi:tetratricopeptide (TPR) repeat protein
MTRKSTRFILAVLLLAAYAGVGFAQTKAPDPTWKGKSRVAGTVIDEQGKPVEGAIVMLRKAEEMTGPNMKTDKRGEFAAKDIKGGAWTVRVQAEGFAVNQFDITVPEKGRADDLEVKMAVDHTAEQMKELQGVLSKGDDLFKAGKYAEARAEYEKVLAARPDVLAIHRSIAYTYGREGNHAKALEHLDIALQEGPNDPEILQLAAASALEVAQPDRALGYIAKIDDSALMDPDLLVNVSITMLRKNFNPAAVTVLDRVVARFPTAPMPYYLRGIARYRTKNEAGAKEDFEKFVEIAPPDSPQLEQAKKILASLK